MKTSPIANLVAKFSMAFVRTYRVTLLLFVATILIGYAAYTTFLTREGNPAVEVPIVIIQTPYFVGNA